MKKLLLLLLCVPLIGFSQYEPKIGSQERKDISDAIRDSVGQKYLCKYDILLVFEDVAYVTVELINKYTNEYYEYITIFLQKGSNSGWYVKQSFFEDDDPFEVISSSLNSDAVSYMNEDNYIIAIEKLNQSDSYLRIFFHLEHEANLDYIRDWMFNAHYECKIDTQTSIIRKLHDTDKYGGSIFICDGCDEVFLESIIDDYRTDVNYTYIESQVTDCLLDLCYHYLDRKILSEEDCDSWRESCCYELPNLLHDICNY